MFWSEACKIAYMLETVVYESEECCGSWISKSYLRGKAGRDESDAMTDLLTEKMDIPPVLEPRGPRLKGCRKKATKAIKDVEDINECCEKVVQVVLTEVISDEDKVLAGVEIYPEDKIATKMSYAEAISDMLKTTDDHQSLMNVGGKCWFLWHVYRLTKIIPPSHDVDNVLRERVGELARDLPVVGKFFCWMTGANYSFTTFSSLLNNELILLLPPLVSLVWEYLQPPSSKQIKDEILLLVKE